MAASTIRVGDARELLQSAVEPGAVDCVVTSPPYWHLKRYVDDEREIGHGHDREEYLAAVGEVLAQCLIAAKPTGVMWLVADTLRSPSREPGPGEIIPLPFQIAEVAQEKGWRFQDIVVWRKNKTLPYSGTGKLRNLTEYILFFTKSQDFKHRPYRSAERHMPGAEWLAGWPERYHPLGARPANIWEFNIDTQGMWDHSERLHYCPFPQGLVARMLELTTDKGDLVLDPFAGIGTVPAQAIAMGRRAVGIELNPASVAVFNEHLLPDFQATWEATAKHRELARQDQLEEALLILRLRLLKAGKEMMRAVDRLAQDHGDGHPAHALESVIVMPQGDVRDFVDVDAGWVGRPPVRLMLLGHWPEDPPRRLTGELEQLLPKPPFSTFGLDISVEFESPDVLLNPPAELTDVFEFGQSRHGAFTAPTDPRLFPTPPRLMTTIRLRTTVEATKHTPLEQVARDAERRLLESELASDASITEIAMRVGLPQAALHKRLVDYGLVEQPKSFAISLPDQLEIASAPGSGDAAGDDY